MYLIVILNPKKTKATAEERGVLSYKLAHLTHNPKFPSLGPKFANTNYNLISLNRYRLTNLITKFSFIISLSQIVMWAPCMRA